MPIREYSSLPSFSLGTPHIPMSAMEPGERKRYRKEVRQQIVERIKTGRAPVSGDTTIRG